MVIAHHHIFWRKNKGRSLFSVSLWNNARGQKLCGASTIRLCWKTFYNLILTEILVFLWETLYLKMSVSFFVYFLTQNSIHLILVRHVGLFKNTLKYSISNREKIKMVRMLLYWGGWKYDNRPPLYHKDTIRCLFFFFFDKKQSKNAKNAKNWDFNSTIVCGFWRKM